MDLMLQYFFFFSSLPLSLTEVTCLHATVLPFCIALNHIIMCGVFYRMKQANNEMKELT